MTYHPGAIFIGISEEVFVWRSTVERGMYRERLWCCIPFLYCRVALTVRSMTAYHRQFYGKYPLIEWYRIPVSQT